MHVVEELKTLLMVSGAMQKDPRIRPQLLRDTVEQLEQLDVEIQVLHEMLAAAERVIHELLPYGNQA